MHAAHARLITEGGHVDPQLKHRIKALRRAVDVLRHTPALLEAVDMALSDLSCDDQRCWCFTRAAMTETHGECACDNCKTWRLLHKTLLEVKPEP